jgi:transposase InsO family protein
VQYLAHFLPDISAYTSPLSAMVKNGQPFYWRPIHDTCFQAIKNICCSTPVLVPVDPRKSEPIWVICDASVSGVGAVYGQGPTWQTCRPAGFMSKKFSDAQRHYRVFEQETIAILEALLKWEDKLIGFRIHVVTDHKALEFFQSQRRLSARQTRWMEYLSRFDFDIRYIKGILNKVSDCLSRYYESDEWNDVHDISKYANANSRLDPEMEDLPWDRVHEISTKAVEMRASRVENPRRSKRLERRLQEFVQDCDVQAEALNRLPEVPPEEPATHAGSDDDPTIFESRARGENLHAKLSPQDSFLKNLKDAYGTDPLYLKVMEHPDHHSAFEMKDGLLWTKNRGGENVVCVPSGKHGQKSLHGVILEQAHEVVGHFGPQRTSDYIRRWYWWPKIYVETKKFCDSCQTCATSKTSNQLPPGLLHSLPVPTRPWESIGMDFIGPFPEVDGKNYLWVVICRLTGQVHLVPIHTSMTATHLSDVYVQEIVRLHGLPDSLVSDRDPKFTSRWWKEVHRLLGAKLLMSTSFHPQTDGATERANRNIGQIFRAAIRPDQRDWVKRCPMTEFAINSSISESTGFAPFELTYGYMPSMIKKFPADKSFPPGVSAYASQALHYVADAHDSIIANRVFQRHHANRRRSAEPSIAVGNLVYLSTKNLSLPKGRASKLLPKFVGPYKVLKANPHTSNYELELPEELRRRGIHPNFHVSLLRPHYPSDDVLFPARSTPDAYDFGAPDDAEWYVDEIVSHRWVGSSIEFHIKWSLGDHSWEPLKECTKLAAFDAYLTLMGVAKWQDLPGRGANRV